MHNTNGWLHWSTVLMCFYQANNRKEIIETPLFKSETFFKFLLTKDYNSRYRVVVIWRLCVLSCDPGAAMSVLRFPFSQCQRLQTENSRFLLETVRPTLDTAFNCSEITLRRGLVALYPFIWPRTTPACQSGRLTAPTAYRQASLFTDWPPVLTPPLGGSAPDTEAAWPRCIASLVWLKATARDELYPRWTVQLGWYWSLFLRMNGKICRCFLFVSHPQNHNMASHACKRGSRNLVRVSKLNLGTL